MGIAKKEQQITFYDLQNLGAHKLEISTAFVKSLKVSFSQQHLFWGEVLHVLVSVSDSQLKILTAFAKSLKVSFTLHLFQCEVFIIMYMFWSQSQIHKQGSWDLGESFCNQYYKGLFYEQIITELLVTCTIDCSKICCTKLQRFKLLNNSFESRNSRKSLLNLCNICFHFLPDAFQSGFHVLQKYAQQFYILH